MRRGHALIAAHDADRDVMMRHIDEGRVYHFDFKKARNPLHHRKFMALMQAIADSSSVYDTVEKALLATKIAVGHCDFVPNPVTGELVAVPKSISFAKMDQTKFDVFYESAVQAVLTHILPQMDRVDLDRAVEFIAGF